MAKIKLKNKKEFKSKGSVITVDVISNKEYEIIQKRKKKNYVISRYYDKLEKKPYLKNLDAELDKKYGKYPNIKEIKYLEKKSYLEQEASDEELEVYEHIPDWRESKADRIASCVNFWDFDVYKNHNVMEYRKTFRCMDKFCANCKKIRTAEYLAQFLPYFHKYKKDYFPFFLTLTAPNVSGDDLSAAIEKFFKSFYLLYRCYFDKITTSHALKTRKYDVVGALRALEVTYNERLPNPYHPHLHILLFIKKHDGVDYEKFFEKNIIAEYNYKAKKYNRISLADVEIRDLWTKLYNGVDRRTGGNVIKDCYDSEDYKCMLEPIRGDDDKGVLEVLKYSFKSSDVKNYDVFETLYFALYRRRMKQGYGVLYNLKFDEETKNNDEWQWLFDDEVPRAANIHLRRLFDWYADYEKVSRYKYRDLVRYVEEKLED